MSESYYDILGVSEDATDDEIKKAFRKKAKENHPDAGGDEEVFKKINEAYTTLSDKKKREEYDAMRQSPFGQRNGYAGGPATDGNGNYYYTYTSDGPINFEDLFNNMGRGQYAQTGGTEDGSFRGFADNFDPLNAFFSRMYDNQGSSGSSRHQSRSYNPSSNGMRRAHLDPIHISLADAINGTSVNMTVTIQGDGNKPHNVTAKIPPQSHDGDTIGITLGIPGYSVTSDVAIDLDEDVHIDGNDVIIPMKIPFIVATLGGKVTTRLANGNRVKIKIPDGTDSGTKFNVSKGAYNGGKCIFVAMVTVPKNLDDVKKTLVRQIAE